MPANSSVCVVIPARLKSTRLAEKALVDINGKPMIQHVYERALKIGGVSAILVATDHERIVKAVEKFGGQAVMTPEDLSSGTDRVAYVAKSRAEKIFINVQGDEPMLDPVCVEQSLQLVRDGRFTMATPAAQITDQAALNNPNVVKVLIAADQRAVYFSRFSIPYSRGAAPQSDFCVRHHLGVYVYTRETLLKFASLPKSPWEAAESLEQLRALYHGISIGVAEAGRPAIGVDTQEDLEAVRRVIS